MTQLLHISKTFPGYLHIISDTPPNGCHKAENELKRVLFMEFDGIVKLLTDEGIV